MDHSRETAQQREWGRGVLEYYCGATQGPSRSPHSLAGPVADRNLDRATHASVLHGAVRRSLNQLCHMSVRECQGVEVVEAGSVYIAPAGWHMTVARTGHVYRTQLSKLPAGTLHTPSVDVLMHSVASVFGNRGMGIILTGMGADGALGMKAIRAAGGWTIGQNAETCTVYGMPRSAAEMNALSRVVPLDQIAAEIVSAFPQRAAMGAALGVRNQAR